MTRNERILALKRAGLSVRDIAREVGSSVGTVAGVVFRAARDCDDARARLVRAVRVTPDVHRAVVADHFTAGLNYPQLAAKHGLAQSYVWRLINEVRL